jgi:UDP-N-acetylglucosamine diphosphorylase/glucosamine-1-phosphate N-acetyltransferase
VSRSLLFLFDDHRARRWAPFTLTRPVGELPYGYLLLRERAERVLDLECSGHLTRPALSGFDEPDAAPVLPLAEVPDDRPRVLLLSRAVLERPFDPSTDEPRQLLMNGSVVGWSLPAGAPTPDDRTLRFPRRSAEVPGHEVEGTVLDRPWHLVEGTRERMSRDHEWLFTDDSSPPGVIRIGEGRLSVGPDSEIEPGVVVDTRGGGVRLDEGTRVEGPARLVGPLRVRAGSHVFGGSVGTSYIGPVCKIRGELSASVLLAFVNKAHDGYLGRAMVGRWVNLGALTTNSDLKNNYGPIRVWTLDGERDTGLIKVGCFMGDHVKTGIGTVINTGTVLGAGSNIFGGLMPPGVVPPFSWGSGADLRDYRLDKFFEAAERSMERRGQSLTPGMRRILTQAWNETRVRRDV